VLSPSPSLPRRLGDDGGVESNHLRRVPHVSKSQGRREATDIHFQNVDHNFRVTAITYTRCQFTVRDTHVGVSYRLTMGVGSCILNQIGIGLGWVYVVMGILSKCRPANPVNASRTLPLFPWCMGTLAVGSGVFPVWCVLNWKKATGFAAMVSAVVGQAVAIACWIVAAYIESKTVSIESLGTANATLVVSIVTITLHLPLPSRF